jgi:hypothetical protein
MTKTAAIALAEQIVRDVCSLQNLIDEGDAQQKQIGRDAMTSVAAHLTELGLLDELISHSAWQMTAG